MKISINTKLCKSCGICIEFCPKKVLELNEIGKIQATHEERCVSCGQCELLCPDYAIDVNNAR